MFEEINVLHLSSVVAAYVFGDVLFHTSTLRSNLPISFYLPVYSGKQMLSADFLIFSANRSFLLRKRMMEVSMKNLLLQIESNSIRDSCMRFCGGGKEMREGEKEMDGER